jgi:RNA polymerase sigma-70 factor, ECF subfamily
MQITLVERARNGDHAAFTQLIDLEGDRCYAIAYRILRDRERAADAVQQTWLSAWRDLPNLRDPERFTAWLHRLLVHASYSEHRRRRRWDDRTAILDDESPAGSDATGEVDVRDALERAFAQLSAEHRAVVVLHHYAGLSLVDVAEVVGAPVGTVKSRLYYGTRALRSAIASADRPVIGEVPA